MDRDVASDRLPPGPLLDLDRALAGADVLLASLERRLVDPRDRLELNLAREQIARGIQLGKLLRP